MLKGAYNTVRFTVENGIGFVTLDDPSSKNAIDIDTLDGIIDSMAIANSNDDIRAVIIRGAGGSFSSGGNIKGMGKLVERKGKPLSGEDKLRVYSEAAWAIRTCKKPVIAWIEGAAAGAGLSLAVACDFRFAQETSKFVFAFAKIGLMPDMGATYTVCRMLGTARATELFMTARTFLGTEAQQMGLINEALPADKLEARVMEFATTLANGPTLAYGCIKEAINDCMMKGFDEGSEYEATHQPMLGQTQDSKEAKAAFVEKRTPQYKGK